MPGARTPASGATPAPTAASRLSALQSFALGRAEVCKRAIEDELRIESDQSEEIARFTGELEALRAQPTRQPRDEEAKSNQIVGAKRLIQEAEARRLVLEPVFAAMLNAAGAAHTG